jgi:hypothetical protein
MFPSLPPPLKRHIFFVVHQILNQDNKNNDQKIPLTIMDLNLPEPQHSSDQLLERSLGETRGKTMLEHLRLGAPIPSKENVPAIGFCMQISATRA